VPARRAERQAHSVVGAASTSGRATATFPVSAPAVTDAPVVWRAADTLPYCVPPYSRSGPAKCSAAGRTLAGPRFRPGTGQDPASGMSQVAGR